MKFLVGVFLVVFSLSVKAEEVSIVGHGLSYHTRDSKSYNQENLGLGVRLATENVAIQLGSYNNSYSQTSNYLVIDLNVLRYNLNEQLKIELGPTVGVVTGYPGHELLPGAGLHAALLYDRFYIRGRAMPALRAGAVGAVEIGYTLFRW